MVTGTNDLEFIPTKQWLTEHKYRPKECICPDVSCHCVLDHFNQHGYGFCVGVCLEEQAELDMVRFCDRTYDPDTNEPACASRQWHPNEAQLVATFLSMATIDVWRLLPGYRNQLGKMGRQRTRNINRQHKSV